MANSAASSLNYWRNYLKTAKANIFEVIDNAIMVAASDYPEEFMLKRDAIAERLFSHRFGRLPELACGCSNYKNGLSENAEVVIEEAASKENKVNNNNGGEMNVKDVSNPSYEEVEALRDVIEQESQCVKEVLRIEDVLLNWEEEGTQIASGSKDVSEVAKTLINDWRKVEDVCIKDATPVVACTPDSLNAAIVFNEEGLPSPPIDEGAIVATKTGSMELSKFCVSKKGDERKISEIGHPDKSKCLDDVVVQVKLEANRTKLQDQYQQAGNGSDGTSTSIVHDDEEVGLALPPMDEEALYADVVSMDLSQFFDSIDDDGNLQQSEERLKDKTYGRRQCLNQDIDKMKSKPSSVENIIAKDSESKQEKKNAAMLRSNKPASSGHAVRPPKPIMQRKGDTDRKMPQNILKDDTTILKRPPVGQKSSCLDDATDQLKLEATKRKLHECYKQAANAKRQRAIQVIELHNIPKQGDRHRYQIVKPGKPKRGHGRK